jgi:hypothetical protein
MSTSALLLAALLSAAEPVAPAARDPSQPPDGTPADRQLWTELQDGASRAMVEYGRINQLAYRTQYGRYYEALDAVAATEPSGTRAQEAARLRARLEAAARRSVDARPPEGVSIRECRGVLLEFGNRMPELSDPAIAKEIPSWRDQARTCATDMRALVKKAGEAAAEYGAALDAIDAFLGRAAPVAPSGPAPSTGPGPG